MSSRQHNLHRKAVRCLFGATIFWGLSFPVMRSLGLLQASILPGGDSWFMSSAAIFVRFALAAVVVAAFSARSLGRLSRLEVYQGAGLGVSGGIGLLFQMDGLAYTSASTSAFLTQSYCLILPLIAAVRGRRRPGARVWWSCLMVLAGVSALSRLRWDDLRLGRGELETLVGSLIFTFQILWLERPLFRQNKVSHFSLVMFVGTTLVCLPVALWHGSGNDWLVIGGSGRFWLFTAILAGPCSLVSYLMMNKWQPFVPAAEAGLIYAVEPVWASLFALFLPALISRASGLPYENEKATWALLVGGGLITGANVLTQTGNHPTPPVPPIPPIP
jgi:drug/metabolite transporter (DMT)-like permease